MQAEFSADTFELKAGDEDIHTAVERRLTEIIGEVGGKLHTGRSRNDQVATDTRIWLKWQIVKLRNHLVHLQQAILAQAEAHFKVGSWLSHLQQAQPIRLSHWLLSFGWMLQRDKERLDDLTQRVDVLPFGQWSIVGQSVGH